jgi:predicted RNase H-like HicB family nuclease
MIASRHEYRGYVFAIEYEPRSPAYTVRYEDFPEVITSAANLAKAFANACEALDLHLESLQKLGKRKPKPKHALVVQPT